MIETRYDREADAVAVDFRDGRTARTIPVSETVNGDLDAQGRILSIEILDASWHLSKATLDTIPSRDDEPC